MRQLAKTCHKSATSDIQYNAVEAIILYKDPDGQTSFRNPKSSIQTIHQKIKKV